MSLISEIQKSFVDRLTTDTVITGYVSNRVYGDPPENPTYPFIRFGRQTELPDETFNDQGEEVDISLEVHDRPASGGRRKTLQILQAIRNRIHRQESTLTITGYTCWSCENQGYNLIRDTDGLSYIGIINFNLRLQNG